MRNSKAFDATTTNLKIMVFVLELLSELYRCLDDGYNVALKSGFETSISTVTIFYISTSRLRQVNLTAAKTPFFSFDCVGSLCSDSFNVANWPRDSSSVSQHGRKDNVPWLLPAQTLP